MFFARLMQRKPKSALRRRRRRRSLWV